MSLTKTFFFPGFFLKKNECICKYVRKCNIKRFNRKKSTNLISYYIHKIVNTF